MESFFKHANLIAYLFVVVIRREVDVGADSGMEVGRRKWTEQCDEVFDVVRKARTAWKYHRLRVHGQPKLIHCVY